MKKSNKGLVVVVVLYLVGSSGTTFNKAAGIDEIGAVENNSQRRVSDTLRHDSEGGDSQLPFARSGPLMLQLKPNLGGDFLSLLLQTNRAENFIFGSNTLAKTEQVNQADRNDRGENTDSDADADLDGPEAIRERNLDYRRRHGIDKDFDPNQRLQLVQQQYERMEAEKAEQASRPDAIPGTNWVSIGPSNVAGRMTAIAVHPTIAGTAYAGAAGGGVWRTTDGGASWTVLTDSITDLAVGALAIAPSSSNTIYLGTGEVNSNVDAIPGIGFLKSTDGGQTWQFPASVISRGFSRISVHPTNANELVIATDDGGFRSTDGGQTWTNVISASTPVKYLIRNPNNPQILYATTTTASTFRPAQILKSSDGGITWTAKSNGVPVESLFRLSITMAPSNPLVMYTAGESNDNLGAHIYKTVDGGESWSELTAISGNTVLRTYFRGQSLYDNVLVVSPMDPNTVIAGGARLIKSTDGGASWNFILDSVVHADYHDFQYQGATLYMANDGGVWTSSDDAVTATNRNASLVTRQYYTAANDPINRNRVFGGAQDNGTSRRPDTGNQWTDIVAGDGFDCAVNPYAPEIFYGTIQNGVISRTRTAATTGPYTNNVGPNYPANEGADFFTILTMDPNNPSVLYTAGSRVWKSVDGGDNWAPLPITTTDGSDWFIVNARHKVAVAASDPNVLIATDFRQVFRSTNGGTSWVRVILGIDVLGVEIDPRNASVFYIATTDGVYVTTNAGVSFTLRNTGLPAGFAAEVVRVDPTDSNDLFCGTDVGVYRSTNQGVSWSKFGTGLPSVSVYDIRILPDGSVMRAATHGRGMWELQIPSNGNTPPTATLSQPASTVTVANGTTLNLQGTVSDSDAGDSATGIWYFSDTGQVITAGSGSLSQSHTFNRFGIFSASLTAKDTRGALGNASRTVQVLETFDNCATPLQLPGSGPFPLSRTATKAGGTEQASDPQTQCSGVVPTKTFWFEFTPTVSAVYTFSATSSSSADALFVMQGPTCGPYTTIASSCPINNAVAPVTTPLQAGATIRIMAGSVSTNDNSGTVTLSVNKGPDCTFTVGSTSQSFSASGGEGAISSTTPVGSGCGTQSVTSNDSWITTFAGDSGNIRYIVAANYGSQARTGTLTALGQTFTVTQSGSITACNPLPSGITAWWRGEGNALDQAGLNNGTLTNNMTYGGGKVGGGFKGNFNTNAGIVDVPDAASLVLNQSFTVEGWLKLDGYNGTIIRRVPTQGGSLPIYTYTIGVRSTGELSYDVFTTNTSGGGTLSNTALPLGQFAHFAITLDNATNILRFYINGTAQGVGLWDIRPVAIDPSRNPRIQIGNINGITDELSIYNRVLTPAEIQAIYNAGTAATGAAGKCLPTQPPVIVDGKVLTSDGRGLRNATVSITDSQGVVRTATTSSFGFFSFDNVAVGQTYTLRVSSRLFRFAPQTVQVNGNLTLPDFVGLE